MTDLLNLEILTKTMDNLAVGIGVFRVEDPNDLKSIRYVFINKILLREMRKEHDEVVGKLLIDVIPEAYEDEVGLKVIETYRDIAVNGGSVNLGMVEYSNAEVAGIYETSVHHIQDNYVYIMLRNVTELEQQKNELAEIRSKKAEESLASEKAILSAIIENIPVMLTRYYPDTNISFLNKEFEKIIGWKTEDLETINLLEEVYPDPEYREQVLAYMLKGTTEWKEFELVSKWGDKVISEWCNIKLADGTQIGIGLDTTERRKAEEEIERSRNKLTEINENLEKRVSERTAKLEEKNKELEQFSFITSHDLQEPLRTISNYIEVIHDDFDDSLNEEVQTYLQAISSSTERMRSLVSALLRYSRLGKSSTLVELSSTKIIGEVMDDLQLLIQSKKAKIKIVELPKIYAYETELRQVFQNLISNALKFQKENHTPEIEINYTELADHHQFSVSDNGIGIASKDVDRIFQIFQKLHLEKTYEGFGIGLSYCKKIIGLHGGETWVESELGKGSTFHFTISKQLKT